MLYSWTRVQWLVRLDTLGPALLPPPSRAGGRPLLWDWDQRRGLASLRKAGSPRREPVSCPNSSVWQPSPPAENREWRVGRQAKRDGLLVSLRMEVWKMEKKECPDSDKDSAKEQLCLCYLHSYGFSSGHVRMWDLDHKKAECWRTDTFGLWYWRRLLRITWTARRSN